MVAETGHPGATPARRRPPAAGMAALLARWDEHLIWIRRLLAAERGAYARGHTAGHAAGYAQAIAEFKAGHHAVVADLHAERVMWGGRRDQFARPRPGDYPGTERREVAS